MSMISKGYYEFAREVRNDLLSKLLSEAKSGGGVCCDNGAIRALMENLFDDYLENREISISRLLNCDRDQIHFVCGACYNEECSEIFDISVDAYSCDNRFCLTYHSKDEFAYYLDICINRSDTNYDSHPNYLCDYWEKKMREDFEDTDNYPEEDKLSEGSPREFTQEEANEILNRFKNFEKLNTEELQILQAAGLL